MVQRLLAAKSLSHAQGGTLFAGFMKILPIFLIVMPGMISRVLFTGNFNCNNIIYILLTICKMKFSFVYDNICNL